MFGLYENTCGIGDVAPAKLLDSETKEECDKPHDFEVFDVIDTLPVQSNLPDAAYPGVESLKSLGVARCEMTLNSPWVKDGAKLKLTTLVPSQSAWTKDKSGNAERKIWCIAGCQGRQQAGRHDQHEEGQLTER